MTDPQASDLQQVLNARFGDMDQLDLPQQAEEALQGMAARGSCRTFQERAVPEDVMQALCAVALASPSKSDLQQRDIILLRAPERKAKLADLVAGQAWVAEAPALLVFCGNNRRHRLLHKWHDVPFANDHLDAFFNAAADAAIALGAFVTAAEAVGLGCCPISAVRNKATDVSQMLDLPAHVFPFAGLAVGYPKTPPEIAMRLPLHVTCHTDRYSEDGVQQAVQAYDTARAARQPYAAQRFPEHFADTDSYGWSEDKVRQYSQPERADFGAYVRAQGFCLD